MKRQVRQVLVAVPGGPRLARRVATTRPVVALRARGTDAAESAFRTIRSSGTFDQDWYERLRGRRFRGPKAALRDYLTVGWRRGLSPHPLFEPRVWDPHWRDSDRDPFSRYLSDPRGQLDRSPHPLIDVAAHAEEHPQSMSRPGGPFADLVGGLDDASPMSLDFLLDRPASADWGTVRRALEERAEVWREQERLRTAPRITSRSGPSRTEREFLRRTGDLPAPTGDGGSPRVTVVLPVRDRAERLRAAVASVQAQTFADWELVVVDDGSTDDTPRVLEGLAAFEPRLRVVTTEAEGVGPARNRALAEARGRFVAFLDSDNTWEPDFLRLMVLEMERRGLDAAYAGMEVLEAGRLRHRGFGGGREFLLVGNHIDLNVLVVRTDLLRRVGGFDEGLRRAVDYDLVLRLTEHVQLEHLPFVGARYAQDLQDDSRISVRESLTWDYVVRARHGLNWSARPPGVAGRTSVLTSFRGSWRRTARRARWLLEQLDDAAPGGRADAELVLVDRAGERTAGLFVGLLPLADPRIRVVRTVTDLGPSWTVDTALLRCTGEVAVVLPPDADPLPGCLGALSAALGDPRAMAVQPVVMHPNGGWLTSAGGAIAPYASTPVDLLAGHPRDEVDGRAPYPVPVLRGGLFAARTADLAAVRGLDPLFAGDCADSDLSLRLLEHRGGEVRVVPSALSTRDPDAIVPSEGLGAHDGASFRQRWTGRLQPLPSDPWARFGLQAAHTVVGPEVLPRDGDIRPAGAPAAARPDPVAVAVVRPRSLVTAGPGAGLPSLRWAIKTAAPEFARRDAWGDWHFAQDLARALRRWGQQVVVDTAAGVARPAGYLDDVSLTVRGRLRVQPLPGRVDLLWVISNPETVGLDEARRFHAVFAASTTWAEQKSAQWGLTVRPLLQCTDPGRFRPDAGEPDSGARLLFVGNSRGVFRTPVRAALESGLPLTLYGSGWDDFVPEGALTDRFLPPERVPAAYATASVVLNDHWPAMRESGILSNRLFDAAATGTRVLSDRVDGVDELFGGLVVTYRDPAELADLLRRPLDDLFPDVQRRREVAAGIARDHSFDARAQELVAAACEARERLA